MYSTHGALVYVQTFSILHYVHSGPDFQSALRSLARPLQATHRPLSSSFLWFIVNHKMLETGLRTNSAGIPYTLLLRIEAIGFPTFGLPLYI